MVVLEGLKGVRNFMGNGETPILEYNNNLIPIAHNLVLPTRMPNMNDVLAGFIFKGNIEVTGCTIFDSPCGGKMCDDANNMQDGRVRAKCPCMQTHWQSHDLIDPQDYLQCRYSDHHPELL